jgi:redox-sensitive bicupin YhaK (pirin superfamily)
MLSNSLSHRLALPIHACARVRGATLRIGETIEYALGDRRNGYLVPAAGAVEINATRIDAHAGAAINNIGAVKITAIQDSERIMVDAL